MASIGPPALGAKGCVERLHPTGETTHYDLCVAPLLQIMFAVHRFAQGAADWRSGPRWTILSVLCPVHPFPLRGNSPQGETRDMKRKTGESYASCTTPAFPLWWLAPLPEPFMKRVFRGVLFFPRLRGKSGAVGKGEASAASQSAEWLFCHMALKVNPVTLTLYSSPPKGETTHYILRVASAPSKCVRCAPKGDTTTLGPKGRQT